MSQLANTFSPPSGRKTSKGMRTIGCAGFKQSLWGQVWDYVGGKEETKIMRADQTTGGTKVEGFRQSGAAEPGKKKEAGREAKDQLCAAKEE